jgi:hypothetical protein
MTNLQINQQSPNQLLSRRQAAEYLGVKENTALSKNQWVSNIY